MSDPTSRVAQLIATEADKYLGVRPDGHAKPQDKAAAEAITAQYLLIPRADLPECAYIERDGKTHVDVEGAEAGTWPVTVKAETNRQWGLEYLAASIAIERWNSKQEVLKREKARRADRLAEELGCPGLYTTLIDAAPMKLAIDRIIELENKK